MVLILQVKYECKGPIAIKESSKFLGEPIKWAMNSQMALVGMQKKFTRDLVRMLKTLP